VQTVKPPLTPYVFFRPARSCLPPSPSGEIIAVASRNEPSSVRSGLLKSKAERGTRRCTQLRISNILYINVGTCPIRLLKADSESCIFIHPRLFRVKPIDFVEALGAQLRSLLIVVSLLPKASRKEYGKFSGSNCCSRQLRNGFFYFNSVQLLALPSITT
jgi:hypothetical protein